MSEQNDDGFDILKELQEMVIVRLLDDLDPNNPDDLKLIRDCVNLYQNIKRVLSAIDRK
tara:strand:- start:4689 stop:4865 length:177 start_codon:yes stop_codon:yes gene_type:complete